MLVLALAWPGVDWSTAPDELIVTALQILEERNAR